MSRTQKTARRSLRTLVVALTALSAFAATALAYADGVDVSHWQGTVNWSQVRSDNVTFAFMKATEGTNYTDPSLAQNWAGARQVGIFRAAYHFARPSIGSGPAQARYFVAKAGLFHGTGDLPPVLDLEVTGGLSPAALRTWVSSWLTTVEQLTGRTPILYFSPYFWIDHLGNSTAFTRYPLWIAHYTTNGPLVPGGWSRWTFWQRTSSGHVSGISGSVDMNRFNGTSAQLAALAQAGGGSGGPVTPGPTLPGLVETSVGLTPSSTVPAIDTPVTFSGDLKRTGPVTGLASRTVSLWARRPGAAWAQVADANTDAVGHYSLTARVPTTADYQTRFVADPTYAASASPVLRLTTPARAASKLFLRKDKAVVHRSAPLMLFGHLMSGSAGVADGVVRYYKRLPTGGPWEYVGQSTSLAPTGWHSLTVHPKVSRVWKAVYDGDEQYLSRRSTLLRVVVVP